MENNEPTPTILDDLTKYNEMRLRMAIFLYEHPNVRQWLLAIGQLTAQEDAAIENITPTRRNQPLGLTKSS